jgi:prepilin-type N-terminal cleavage/methylation domain-containing protein
MEVTKPNPAFNGFTLIEMLVVIVLIGLLVTTGSLVFIASLKASSKSQVMTAIKQEGNYALGLMERYIRNARKINVCQPAGNNNLLTLTNPDQEITTFSFAQDGSLWRLASNSAYLTNTNVSVDTDKPYYFGCTFGPPARVEIVFTLKSSGASSRPEEQAFLDFKTTVLSRNY